MRRSIIHVCKIHRRLKGRCAHGIIFTPSLPCNGWCVGGAAYPFVGEPLLRFYLWLKTSTSPPRTTTDLVRWFSLQYCSRRLFVLWSIRAFTSYDLGFADFGLPVRGFIKTPRFLFHTLELYLVVAQKVQNLKNAHQKMEIALF